MTVVSHFLLVLASSSNIAIYCWKDEKFRKVGFRAHAHFYHLDIQVLLGLLGWGPQPAEGGGVLRGGGASNLHRDLTVTTCAPWDPGALSTAPVASSNRGEVNRIVETGFISHTSIQTISTIPGTDSPDKINLTSNLLET